MSDEPKLPEGIEYGYGGKPVARWIDGKRHDYFELDTKVQTHCMGCGLPMPTPVILQLAPGAAAQFFCGIECLHLHLDACREAIDGDPGRHAAGEAVLLRDRFGFDHVINELAAESPAWRDEVEQLLRAAGRRIAVTLCIARRNAKYGPYAWRDETRAHQAKRAAVHLHNFNAKTSPYYTGPQDTRGAGGEADAATELEHALTRLALLAALEDEGRA